MKLKVIETKQGNLQKLVADEGMVLTNGDVYTKGIWLGCNDSAENWNEITDAEYEKILGSQVENL